MTQARDLADGKFDTNTLVVDAANNRVGVGTTSPADHLAVVTSGANAQLSVDRSDGATGRTVLIHSSSGGQLQTTGSVPLIFGTADTERGRFLSGGGLTFNGDTAAANALDDYEEGTWTPNVKNGSSSSTFTTKVGKYTKIGNMVYAQFLCDHGNTGTAGSNLELEGLPFTVNLGSTVISIGTFAANGSGENNGNILSNLGVYDGGTIMTVQKTYMSGCLVYRTDQ